MMYSSVRARSSQGQSQVERKESWSTALTGAEVSLPEEPQPPILSESLEEEHREASSGKLTASATYMIS